MNNFMLNLSSTFASSMIIYCLIISIINVIKVDTIGKRIKYVLLALIGMPAIFVFTLWICWMLASNPTELTNNFMGGYYIIFGVCIIFYTKIIKVK